MPTILSHPAVPLAIGVGLGARAIPPRLLATGMLGAMLPDLDVVGFCFGVPYGAAAGHRGFSHSPFFAAVVALLLAAAVPAFRARFRGSFCFLFTAIASHGVLDAFTNGGSGVAFLWPFADSRFFAPLRMIEVSPIGIAPFFSARGAEVLLSEIVWVWLPCAVIALALALVRARVRPNST